jgi:hypothetical protein
MNDFVYLYRSPPSPSLSAQQMQDRMQRWNRWFRDLEKRGALASLGHPLQHAGGGVVRDKTGTLSDGPFAETKDIVIGFSVIQAKTFDEAVSFATACPIFDQGGVVEVRPIATM